ncbi:DUF1521 domain-containing protein [Qipengyuania qiaonensis]|uniref:DUF1521 domain-containing protein n=1 Tax=Qipengyuania qiaonensis TaxID=2867240 RepID=A0ABS7J5X1_9SPHN|nr:DUF1521 domain-containing protein [Qipengyuania qiaonensis]MBX7482739.1 DUF1521 domain-containing protein [Qipengyuania qiaonensis]
MINSFNLGATVAASLGLTPAMNSHQHGKVATGIIGTMFSPLGASPFAFGAFPQTMRMLCFCGLPDTGCIPPGRTPEGQWTAELTGQSTAEIDLGDGYTLQLDERSSEIYIRNSDTGETTRIWGDPHVDVDGKRAFDFWGTTTFTLENGTKVTINTEQWGGNPNAYVASQVVITKGSNAIVVDGISQNKIGDLNVSMSNNGYAIDAQHRDGFVLHENATGTGWRSEFTGEVATQADLNATRVGREYGPGSETLSLGESAEMMSSFLVLGSFAAMLGASVSLERD